MKIARAKVAETAKDLARPTVMHMVFSLAALPHQLRRSIPAPRRIPARLAGGFTEACSALPYNERCGRLFALGRSERGASCDSHTDVIAPDEGRSSPI